MKWVPATVLADKFGISRRTVTDWCSKVPKLARKQVPKRRKNAGKGNVKAVWLVNIDRLARVNSVDPMEFALELKNPGVTWFRGIDLARISRLPLKTIANWYSQIGIRLGHNMFISSTTLEHFATPEQMLELRRQVKPRGVS